jgi:hypothetical protein
MNTVQQEVHWRGGKDADSNVESDLNGRKEQVWRASIQHSLSPTMHLKIPEFIDSKVANTSVNLYSHNL